jgi:translocation and assembly module TamB
VQSLDDDPTIEVGTYDPRSKFILLPLHAPVAPRSPSATHMRVAVELGDITIKRDTDLRITLSGRPVIDITDKTHMSGQIKLRRGMVNLYGKKFVLEHGTVTFAGDEPSNPQILVTAHYDAPDGTRVYADIDGPVRTIKVNLRSEPAHTQNEILSLILFGSIDGETGAPPPDRQPNAESEAAGVAGGFVAQGVNKALEGVSGGLEIATKLDTSDALDPRPSVDVQVSEDVLLDVTYNLGLPPPGENPDRTLVSVDYRFARSWSLEGTVGDKGSSILDLLWHHRY